VVRLLLQMDRRGRLRFAPLQGPPAQAFLRAHGFSLENFDSLVLVPDWARRDGPAFLLRTTAVIAALRICGGIGPVLAAALRLIPAKLRDAGYRFVARWRYRVFGAWRPRPLPHPEWAERFLDPSPSSATPVT
jgi:predicted DCC family thiol-disulfide oxidoreductase YuxK